MRGGVTCGHARSSQCHRRLRRGRNAAQDDCLPAHSRRHAICRSHVEGLIRRVEAGRFLDAIDAYYAEDASTREPGAAPVTGKAALPAKERGFLESIAVWQTREALDVLVDGPLAAIRWRFEVTRASGERSVLAEVALQRWRGDGDGAGIVHEQYFSLPPSAPSATG